MFTCLPCALHEDGPLKVTRNDFKCRPLIKPYAFGCHVSQQWIPVGQFSTSGMFLRRMNKPDPFRLATRIEVGIVIAGSDPRYRFDLRWSLPGVLTGKQLLEWKI